MMKINSDQFSIRPFLFLIGVACILVNGVTLQRTYAVGGTTLFGYGYPLSWMRWSVVSPMEYNIQIPSLILNVALNLLAVLLVWNLLFALIPRTLGDARVKLVLQFLGAILLTSSIGMICIDGKDYRFAKPLFDSSWRLQKTQVHVGFDHPYRP
jgi:hypothetical protein